MSIAEIEAEVTCFYSLPYNAQVVYRRFFVHNDYKRMDINLSTLIERLNLRDKNITNLVRNPLFLDSDTSLIWTVNPTGTGQ